VPRLRPQWRAQVRPRVSRHAGCRPQEVRLMQSIRHPHVVRFEASFVDEMSVVIIMEHASGGTVADLIQERRDQTARFEEDDVWRCLLQVRAPPPSG
jgi:serine/threonine protein kinase